MTKLFQPFLDDSTIHRVILRDQDAHVVSCWWLVAIIRDILRIIKHPRRRSRLIDGAR